MVYIFKKMATYTRAMQSKSAHKSSDSPPSKKVCLVCDKIIRDNTKGQVSIFCKGEQCQGWIHRVCGGINKKAFQAMAESPNPFYCLYCTNSRQENEISELKQVVQNLQSEISQLKEGDTQTLSRNVINDPIRETNHLQSQYPTDRSALPQDTEIDRERKYNVIVFGMKENPKDTPRHDRIAEVTDNIESLLHDLHSDIQKQSIRDCIRLGKYSEERNRPFW